MTFSVGVDTTSTGTWEPGQNLGNPSLIWAWFSGFPAPAESRDSLSPTPVKSALCRSMNNCSLISSGYKFSTRIANECKVDIVDFYSTVDRVVIIIFFTCKFV